MLYMMTFYFDVKYWCLVVLVVEAAGMVGVVVVVVVTS